MLQSIFLSRKGGAATTTTRRGKLTPVTDAALPFELLASYEAAVNAASFALKAATALAEANQRGERLSESE